MRRRFSLRRYRGVTTFVAVAVAALVVFIPAAIGSGNAGYTTFDTTLQGCNNGSGNGVNCNIYDAKEDVFMNGGPTGGSGLDEGNYYFTVLAPGSQNGGFIDGATGNLSSGACGGGSASDRSFTENADHTITNTGTHADGTAPDGNDIIQLAPFCDTPNEGGVYIMAICKAGATSPSDCKYDAFKIKACTEDCGTTPAGDLTGSKTAGAEFTREFNWTIQKSVVPANCATVAGCSISGTTQTLNYTVSVSHSTLPDSGFEVRGDITVTNSNAGDASDVTVNDAIDNGGSCSVGADSVHGLLPGGGTLLGGQTALYPYTCTFGSNPGTGTNTATVTWNPFLSDNTVTPTAFFTAIAGYTFGDPTKVIHDCVDVTDNYPAAGTALGTVCSDASNPTTFAYSRTVTVPHDCVTVNNTATFNVQDPEDPADGDDTGSSLVTAKVCRVPAQTGALTMGFWQNKNGQKIITSYSGTNCQSLRTWLNGYAPFADLTATTCTGVAAYVTNVIKAATCGGATCNAMLKAQMLATALDVYFSDPALGGNRIGASSPIGARIIDLTQICQMIDGSGGSTCTGTYYNVSSAFGGATCLSVSGMLTYAASQSNVGGSTWYGQVKATQVKAKDAFDSINNVVAFIC